MSTDVRARLALLLSMAVLLPNAAAAQAMRELDGLAGTQGIAPGGPAIPGPGFNGFPGPGFGSPQASPFTGMWPGSAGNAGTAGGIQPGYGWSPEAPGLGGAARFGGMRQAYGGGTDGLVQTQTTQVTFLAMRQFTQTLLDPAIDGRGIGPATPDAELSAYAAMDNDPRHGGIGREAYAAIYGRPSLTAPHWSVWAAGFGGSQVSTGGTGTAGRSFGTVAGVDYALSPQTRMGFALAGGGTGFTNNFSSGHSDLFQAGAFLRHNVGSAYVATALAYGWQAIRSDHQLTPAGFGQFDAAINANAYSGRLEGGYRLATRWLGITPYAAAQVTSFRLPSTTTQPAYAADAPSAAPGSDGFTASRTELGLRTNASLALFGSVMNLRGRLAWAHDFGAGQSIPAAFQSLPGQGIGSGGMALAPNSVLTSIAIELRDQSGWSAAANFDSELSGLIRSYTGKAVVRYAW